MWRFCILFSILLIMEGMIHNYLYEIQIIRTSLFWHFLYRTYWLVAISSLFILGWNIYNIKQENQSVFAYFASHVTFIIYIGKIFSLLIIWILELINVFCVCCNFLIRIHSLHISLNPSIVFFQIGILIGLFISVSMIIGMINKYRFQVVTHTLFFEKLPVAFEGIKIVIFGDAHIGNFKNRDKLVAGVKKIREQNADIICFVGDLVIVQANEMLVWKDLFATLKAPLGVYSILGNHDYGDYGHWANQAEKDDNLQELKNIQADMGWHLLLNESVVLKKGDAHINLLGVEQWGDKYFQRYGQLNRAYEGIPDTDFNILLSHDPSHWDAEVVPKYPHIDLTFAGHTHAGQYMFSFGKYKWSYIQWIYKRWYGLYEVGKQKLFVTAGFGVSGFQGRVGCKAEIATFILKRKVDV